VNERSVAVIRHHPSGNPSAGTVLRTNGGSGLGDAEGTGIWVEDGAPLVAVRLYPSTSVDPIATAIKANTTATTIHAWPLLRGACGGAGGTS